MPSAAPSWRIWVESPVSLTAGASSAVVRGVGSLVEYARYRGASVLATDGRRAGASNLSVGAIDRGRADMVGVLFEGRRMSRPSIMATCMRARISYHLGGAGRNSQRPAQPHRRPPISPPLSCQPRCVARTRAVPREAAIDAN